MKKIILTMLAVVATSASFAQNPDALKAVLKAEKRSEANNIMKEQAATMSGEERAKAYNHLVGMSIEDNSKEQAKAITAKTPEDKDNRTTKQYKAAYDAVKNAQLCNEADNEPNEKGQVKPQFKKKNASRIQAMRNDLVNGGLWAYNKKDFANAEKWFGMYAESHSNDLFSDTKEVTEEKNFGQVAYYAALAAFMNKSYKKADKYANYAIESGDAEVKPEAIKIQLNSYQARKDSGEIDGEYLIKKVKQVYKAYPDNEIAFGRYIAVLNEAGKKEEANKELDKRLKANPNDPMANAYVAQNAQEAGEYDKAIEAYTKVLVAQPDFMAVKYNLATCYRNKALDLKNNNQPYKELLQKAKALFQEIQAADPDEVNFKTKYILSTIDQL